MKGQTFNRAFNECMEPNCDAYYFMTLNEEKHECRTVRKKDCLND